jgi:hypothetical protein
MCIADPTAESLLPSVEPRSDLGKSEALTARVIDAGARHPLRHAILKEPRRDAELEGELAVGQQRLVLMPPGEDDHVG